MSQINVDDSSKEWFDEWAGDRTQSEAFEDMVAQVKAFEGDPVDHEKLAEELSHTLIPQTEIAAYRGAREFHEQHGTESQTGP